MDTTTWVERWLQLLELYANMPAAFPYVYDGDANTGHDALEEFTEFLMGG